MGRTSQPQMGAPKPPTPATGVDVPSLNGGGPPKPPHSHARDGCRLFEWGEPPNPPLPCQGWMSPLRMGGVPQTPPLQRQGWMSPLRMGGTPHSRASGGCHLFEWGGPPTPEPVVDVASSNGGGTPKPPHSRARGECRHFSCNSRYAKTLFTIFAHFAV